MECPNCKNEVFAHLDDGSSQCTRCGFILQQESQVQSEETEEVQKKKQRRLHFF